jgi:hypothetical protein
MEAQTKKQLAINYNISRAVLGYYMNTHFFDELSAVGYEKKMRVLPPKVVSRFYELFGSPEK